jgi:hypothetical protein
VPPREAWDGGFGVQRAGQVEVDHIFVIASFCLRANRSLLRQIRVGGSTTPDAPETRSVKPSTRWRQGLLVSTVFMSICSCTQLSSLSPAVEADTVAYNDALGNIQDQVLLDNIIKAKYYAPLNLSQLSSISGSLNLSGTLGFTLPFGPASESRMIMNATSGTTTSGGAQYQATPSITASTTPTYTVTPLNTSGFTTAIIQQVQPSFVQALHQQGIPPEVLLSLFIKEIDLPDGSGRIRRFVNNPDRPEDVEAFKDLLMTLMDRRLTMKTVDVMEPVGPDFDLHVATTGTSQLTTYASPSNPNKKDCTGPDPDPAATIANPSRAGKNVGCSAFLTNEAFPKQQSNADQQGFSMITNSGDGQYHVGNVSNSHGHLYRVYPGQLLLCVDDPQITLLGVGSFRIPPGPVEEYDLRRYRRGAALVVPTSQPQSLIRLAAYRPANILSDVPFGIHRIAATESLTQIQPLTSLGTGAGGSPPPSSTPSSAGSGKGAQGASPAGSNSSGASNQGAVVALQAQRMSAIVWGGACQRNEIILPDSIDERGLSEESKRFVYIYWRSLWDVFQYLGAVLRANDHLIGGFTVYLSRDHTNP